MDRSARLAFLYRHSGENRIAKRISELLAAAPGLENISTGATTETALAKITLICPDVALIDLDIAGTDVAKALTEIRQAHPQLPLLLLSPRQNAMVQIALEATGNGPTECLLKPLEEDPQSIRNWVHGEVIPALLGLRPLKHPRATGLASVPRTAQPFVVRRRFRPEVIAVGSSTGGPNALSTFLQALPADLNVPILVVQHMPPLFTKLLADRLRTQSSLQIREATDGELLSPGAVFIAPGNYHMRLSKQAGGVRVSLDQEPPENFCRPSVDVLFRAVAAAYGPAALAIVLTGMGQDGLSGCASIRDGGGTVLVQDERSSIVWGMPRLVNEAGLADQVVPIERLGDEVMSYINRGARIGSPTIQ